MKTFVAAQSACLFAVAAVLSLGIASPSSAQMKEGTFSGTYSGFGTVKAMPVGKDRLLVAVDETGFTLTNGFLDHMTWHCWGTADYTNGMGQIQGGYWWGQIRREINWLSPPAMRSMRRIRRVGTDR